MVPRHRPSTTVVHEKMVSPGGARLGSGPNLSAREKPWSTSAVHEGRPVLPRFVKIWITPAAASVPYSVAAAAPLMISMRSMSAGLMSLIGLARSLLLRRFDPVGGTLRA